MIEWIRAAWMYSIGTAIGGAAGFGVYLVMHQTEPCIIPPLGESCPPPPGLEIPALALLVIVGMAIGLFVEKVVLHR